MEILIRLSDLTGFNIYVVCGILGSIVLIIAKKLIQNKSIFLLLIFGFCGYICFDILSKYGSESLIVFILIAGIITIPLTIINPLGVGKENKKR